MPFNNDEGISVDAGCRVLERVKMLCDTGMKTTICSSDIKSRTLMEKMHLGEFHFIDFILVYCQPVSCLKIRNDSRLHQSGRLSYILRSEYTPDGSVCLLH